jgi:ABC-2 type transport system permease protein
VSLALEARRLARSRRPALALGALVFFLLLLLFGFYTYAQSRTGGDVEFRATFENRSYFNGLTFALYAFYFGFVLVLPIFAATEGGVQLAGDTGAGTLALLLARPVTKARLFATKLALAAAYTTALAGGFLVLALALGLCAVGWGDLDLYPGVLQMTARPQHLSQGEGLLRFLFAWPCASLALCAPLCFSFLVSAWSRSAVNAVGTAVALYLVLYVASEVHLFQELRPWLFTSYLAFWRGLFREEIAWSELLRDAAKLAAFACLFAGLAFRRFRTREER